MFDQLFTYKCIFMPLGSEKLVYLDTELKMEIPVTDKENIPVGCTFRFAILDVINGILTFTNFLEEDTMSISIKLKMVNIS